MGRISKARLRPLSIKNTNIINSVNHNNNNTNNTDNTDNASPRRSKSNRKLLNKNSVESSVNMVNCQAENFKENAAPDDELVVSLNDVPVQQPLTEENLKQLQNEIVELENVLFPCEHFLCGLENRSHLNSQRLWLLFELEMSADNGTTNLRNNCYHEHVYEAICSPWRVQSCIQQIPQNVEPFPLQQLIIPEIKLIKAPDLKDVTVQIGDLVEKRKIPPTSLSSLNRQEIFDSTPVNTTAIVRHRHTSEASEVVDEDYEEASGKCRKKPRISTLERKLALIGGMSLPKLTKQ
ncbi:hypothetical protein ZYGR_0AG01480 [Zygosaccharomyces rouxii]|uniref:Uncharacterized protein n=1 Tax=Zygosaccharomyces rouxii TaxID=4956 RepID=A0A1Q3A8Y6_ZYGRO|nr:hypothetical protein ZYGR_0AG01480 [Zygosaccharomyces rouxii]